MSTIREVAERANVSPTTVSHVINQTRFVSDDVKLRVQAAMKDLNYQPNALASSLRSGKTHTIGLILPDSTNPYFAEIGHKVEARAYQLGYSVILCNSQDNAEKESFYLNVLYTKRVDGIILVSVGAEVSTLKFLRERRIPVVAVDRNFPEGELDMVQGDNHRGGWLAARHLIDLGHTRIGCVTGTFQINPSSERYHGFRQALEESGLELDPALVMGGDFRPESGWQLGLQLLRQTDRPTAIFAWNDLMAIGVLRAASECGLRVPQDLSVVGYDDIELSAFINPPLTTVHQPKSEMARIAVECLVSKTWSEPEGFNRHILEPILITRKTSGPAPQPGA